MSATTKPVANATPQLLHIRLQRTPGAELTAKTVGTQKSTLPQQQSVLRCRSTTCEVLPRVPAITCRAGETSNRGAEILDVDCLAFCVDSYLFKLMLTTAAML